MHSQRFYGETFAVYNVHGLIHLSEDMRFGSSLNDISSFHSEDYLQILKKFIRNLQNPVLQVANRISDISYAGEIKKKLNYIPPRQKDNCFYWIIKTLFLLRKKLMSHTFFEIK